MKSIYIGGPLFSQSERDFNAYLANTIREWFGDKVYVYNPQENESINDKSLYADSIDIFYGDSEYLDNTDILIANLDGLAPDPGLSAEVGYFWHYDRPILGLYTDSRQGSYDNQRKIDALDEVAESQFSYANLYVVGAIKTRGSIFKTVEELLYRIEELLDEE